MGQRAQTGEARFQRAQRRQIMMQMLSLDQMLAEDHTARLVWAYVDALDLTERYAKIRVQMRRKFSAYLAQMLTGSIMDRGYPALHEPAAKLEPST